MHREPQRQPDFDAVDLPGDHFDVPDFIPDELLAEHRADVRSVPPNPAGVTASPRSAPTAPQDPPTSGTRPWLLPASRSSDRVQHAHAVVGLLVGYVGLIICTAWWWSLATSTNEPMWWWFATIGTGAVAAATLTLVGWIATHVRSVKGSDQSTSAPSAPEPQQPAA